LPIKAIYRQFRDRGATQEAEDVENGEKAGQSRQIHPECEGEGGRSVNATEAKAASAKPM
jgi:hypothetical protein